MRLLRSSNAGPHCEYVVDKPERGVRNFLLMGKRTPIWLMTPYGLVESGFTAVSRRCKPATGGVSRDRIERGAATESFEEFLRRWYGLRTRKPFTSVELA